MHVTCLKALHVHAGARFVFVDESAREHGPTSQHSAEQHQSDSISSMTVLMFQHEGFRYIGRTQLAPHIQPWKPPKERAAAAASPSTAAEAAARQSSANKQSSTMSVAVSSTVWVEAYRSTPSGQFYVSRYVCKAATLVQFTLEQFTSVHFKVHGSLHG